MTRNLQALTLKRAVFMDKDGTLVEDVPFNVDPAQIRLGRGVVEGLRLLAKTDFQLFVVTNQPGIAKGLFNEAALLPVQQHLETVFQKEGCTLSGFYHCPHDAVGSEPICECRKPRPGMILRACQEHGISAHDSWMVGDILNDVEAGNRAQCRTVLLDNGHETEWLPGEWRHPHHVVADFQQAVCQILAASPSNCRL